LVLDLFDEGCGVVDPLRPRVDVTAPPRALTVAAKVDRVGRHAMRGHSAGEALVPAAVLAVTVDDRESEGSVRERPRSKGQPGSVGRGEGTLGGFRGLRRQGDRIRGGS